MLSFRLNSFSFPAVPVEQGCVLVLASSCNGKEPCCSHPYQSQALCSPHQAALDLFQVSSWNRSSGTCVWGDISLLSWAGQYSCASHCPIAVLELQPWIPDLSLSAKSSFNYYSPLELRSLLDGPSSLLLSRFLPSLSSSRTLEGFGQCGLWVSSSLSWLC